MLIYNFIALQEVAQLCFFQDLYQVYKEKKNVKYRDFWTRLDLIFDIYIWFDILYMY